MYTYDEADAIATARDKQWEDHYRPSGVAAFASYEEAVKSAPEGVFNTNSVHRPDSPMFFCRVKKGVFCYPPGLMAINPDWIPDEAFVPDDELLKPVWEVRSTLHDLDY